jgi:hypothetical protein
MNIITRLIHAIRRLADAPLHVQPTLNRKQRRTLAQMKSGELRARRERTFLMQAKRRSSKRGDHGAKAKRAFTYGVQKGTEFTIERTQSAYLMGLENGRKAQPFWKRWVPAS